MKPYKLKKKSRGSGRRHKHTGVGRGNSPSTSHCRYCGRFFIRSSPDQRYCGNPSCEHERQRAYEVAKAWMTNARVRQAAEEFVKSSGKAYLDKLEG